MASTAEASAFARASRELTSLAQDDLSALTGRLFSRPSGLSIGDVLDAYTSVIDEYAPMSASLSADWYERQRAASGTRGRFSAETAGHGYQPEALQRHSERALRAAQTVGAGLATTRLSGDLDRVVMQAGRNTGLFNAQRERVGWARIPSGSDPCAFCLTLASRGAVYSEDTVTRRDDGDTYHHSCNCVGHRIAETSDYPEDFDPDEMYQVYRAAYNAAENELAAGSSPDINHVVSKLRRQSPDMVRDGVHED